MTCPNVEGYVEAVLDHVRSLMDSGAGGIFVDNVGHRRECFGPTFEAHEHLYRDQVKAFSALLGRVREVIREHDDEGVLLLNSASPETLPEEYWVNADADMAESYICTWVSEDRWMDWHNHWNAMGRKVAKWIDRGKTVLALSYLGHTKNTVKDDAYFCYCSARLSGFLWSAGGDVLKGDPAEILYSIRLGSALDPEEEKDGVHYRVFELGLVAVNPEDEGRDLQIKGRNDHRVLDIYEDEVLGPPGEDLIVQVPANSGRVYLFVPEYVPPDPEPHVLKISTSPPLGNVRFLIDGIESFTKSGSWRIGYVKGANFGMVFSKYGIPGVHEVEALDVKAMGLELSKGYGSVEKLGRLMDPAEPTRPTTGDYRFLEWKVGNKTFTSRRFEVSVDGETNITAIYSTDVKGAES